MKIKYELSQKKVSEYCIRKALAVIDDKDYSKTLQQLAAKKWKSIKGEGINLFMKVSKTKNYLQQRGFEPVLIQQVINALKET